MRSVREGFEFPPDGANGVSVWDPDVALAALYPRLPEAQAQAIASCLRPGASPSDPYPLTEDPPVATGFIYATHDEFFEPDWSRWAARELAGVEPVELDTGHFPMVEAPDALAEVLLRFAR